ncbi:MAG: hypothetical protein DMG13_11230 [Acidobacteria bacterium]|nr:MAG: hypothetical protein DMG13_11230 [Acidobacteriota bacterium]
MSRVRPGKASHCSGGLFFRLRAIALALRVFRLRAIALALRVFRLRAIALALRVFRLRAIALALRVFRLRAIALAVSFAPTGLSSNTNTNPGLAPGATFLSRSAAKWPISSRRSAKRDSAQPQKREAQAR